MKLVSICWIIVDIQDVFRKGEYSLWNLVGLAEMRVKEMVFFFSNAHVLLLESDMLMSSHRLRYLRRPHQLLKITLFPRVMGRRRLAMA